MNINIKYRLNEFIKLQLVVVTSIVFLGLLSYILLYTVDTIRPKFLVYFLRLIDVGAEQSIPTYFSTLNLLLASILLLIIYQFEKVNKKETCSYWLLLSVLFLLLSIDEAASIHENFDYVYQYLVRREIVPHIIDTHQWVFFAVPFVLIIGIYLIPFYKCLPKSTLIFFFISGLIYLIGVIGFELIGAIMLKTGFVDSRENIIYMLRRLFEEGFELYGIAIFNCTLYREILIRKICLRIFN